MVRLLILILAGCFFAFAQPKPEIRQIPPKPTNPASGVEMFKEYCATCHGLDGKGHGPAAAAMKKPVSDLTLLSSKNGGKFPDIKVYNAIQGDMLMEAHGSKDMPIWGTVFRSISRDEGTVKMRLNNLTNYIKSIQK